jgi:hypothetical protein
LAQRPRHRRRLPPTSASNIPITGRDETSATNAALFALAVGFALVVVVRLRTTEEP